MRRRIMFWGIVCCGLVGAMLVAGTAGAKRDQDRDEDQDTHRGGLPACQAKLKTCNASLGTCQTDLAACLAEQVVFPGDGYGSPDAFGVSGHGPALSYTDNGDGTVTDNNTLLSWEKKVGGGGSGTCLTALHGVDSTCTWAQATGAWIAAINAANLGGHNDWRLPNVKELQSIVDYSKIPASSVPGATAADFHWSSTTLAGTSSSAWTVDFLVGGVANGAKSLSLRVRAVRGGP